jgi:MFS superfamily sulfate permease-like transporter
MSDTPVSPAARTRADDILASIVVFLVALPLCMGIAIASGAPVSTGLITGIVAGIVVGSISGCPLQVSGPAAGLTVIIYGVIQQFGLEMLGLIVLLAGALQLVAGLMRMGQWFRAVSPAVIQGMLAGIGVLIFASQFHVMLDDKPQGSGLQNLLTIPAAIAKVADHTGIPAADARDAQRHLLQAVGEVHREQVQLRETLQERLPDHVVDAGGAVDLDDLRDRQAENGQRLEEFLADAEHWYEDTPKKLERVATLHRAATISMNSALAEIESRDMRGILASQTELIVTLERLEGALNHHTLAACIGLLAVVVLAFWKSLVPKRWGIVPAPLVAVVAATVIAAVWTLPLRYVEVPNSLIDEMHFPTAAVLADAPWLQLLQAALLLAIVASAETLLSANAVDRLHDGPRTNYDRELFSQGVGNLICGALGALPMTGVIVRSSANVQAGAKTRLSAVLHGIWLLLFVVAFASLLRLVPIACLAGVLVYTGYKLVNWQAALKLREYGRGELVIYAATVITIVATDLLKGVVLGIVLAVVKLVYTFSHLKATLATAADTGKTTLKMEGAATFIRLPQLAAQLDQVPRGCEFHVDLEQLSYIDHACLDLLMNWTKQHEATGGSTTIDWPLLHMSVRQGTARTPSRSRVA